MPIAKSNSGRWLVITKRQSADARPIAFAGARAGDVVLSEIRAKLAALIGVEG